MKAFQDYPVAPDFSPEYLRLCETALDHALTEIPAYVAWRRWDPGRGVPIDDRFSALPALNKAELRRHFPRGFVSRDRDVEGGLQNGQIEYVHTSGTTDERVVNLWHQPWWDASELASWKLNAHTEAAALGRHREALLTSALSVGIHSDDADLPLERRISGRFLFLNEKSSPARWSDAHRERMIRELALFQPDVLEANPSYLSRLACYAADRSLPVCQPKLIILTFELPCAGHIRQIRRAFRAPVCSSYGTTEAGYVFMQCEHGRFHQNTAFCRVDFQPLVASQGGPAVGRILVTTFGNPWCALLRFQTGDLIRLEDRGRCPCGRNDGITARRIEGRLKNLTLTPDGRLVTESQIDDALARVLGLLFYQVRQAARDRCVLHAVAEADGAAVSEQARAALAALYGPAAGITVSIEPELEPTPSGKYRLALAEFPVEGIARLDPRYG